MPQTKREVDAGEGSVHTAHRDGAWGNTIEGEDELLPGSFETKQAAVIAGREEAMRRKTEHVIHDQDGTIGERNSYGSDPADRPGRTRTARAHSGLRESSGVCRAVRRRVVGYTMSYGPASSAQRSSSVPRCVLEMRFPLESSSMTMRP